MPHSGRTKRGSTGSSVRQIGCSGGSNCSTCAGRVDQLCLGVTGLALADLLELSTRVIDLGHQGLDDTLVCGGRKIALDTATLLLDESNEATGPLPHGFRSSECVGHVVVTDSCECLFSVDNGVVEGGQRGAELRFTPGVGAPLRVESIELGRQPGQVVAREMELDGPELGFDTAVAPGGVGLPLEWLELTTYFPDQILEAQEVALGGLQTTLGALTPLAELEDSRRLLDDRAAIFGSCRENRVELALTHDDVLLAPDSRVGQKLLDVEQAALRTVDLVFGITRTEQQPRDRDLVELDRQQTRGVVDRERHLGATERRPFRRTGEDDVVHLPATNGARALRAQHPRDGVDEVRLAGPVGSDHHRHTRLELDRRAVSETLEALERERLQEHRPW